MDYFEPGIVLDDFEIRSALRDGAMARLYRATDRLSGETVALKVPFKDILNNPLLYYHHQIEDQALRRLAHPRIIRCIRRRRTSLYLALEWIAGPDLKSLLFRRGRIPRDRVLAWAGQILDALAHMHARGVHHLDLKPENILRAPDGRIKLVDFGLAWLRGTRDLLGEDFNNPHGTPDYAAPEQIRGVRHDPRSDLYSLGLVIYELLTGDFPFKRSMRLREVRRRAGTIPVPPRHHDPNIPHWLESIVLRALAPDPGRRFPSAPAMAAALQAGAAGAKTERLWGGGSPEVPRVRYDAPSPERSQPQLLGAIANHSGADGVVAVLRREALRLGGEITLLTVNAERDDSDLVRYATAVEGAQLGRRLESYGRDLRDHGLDALVRIRQGDVLTEVLETARALPADLLVVGATRRRGFQKLFGGRLVDKIIRKAPCRVIVAGQSPLPVPPDDLQPMDLETDDLLDIDFFLHDSWVNHLNHLAAVSRPYPATDDDVLVGGACRLKVWLQSLRRKPDWRPLMDALVTADQRLHTIADKLAEASRTGDWEGMRRVYLDAALPRMCELRQALRDFSLALKTQTAARLAADLPLMREANCPLGGAEALPDGPLASLASIRDYFCQHPDASPEACLVHLGGRAISPTAAKAGEE